MMITNLNTHHFIDLTQIYTNYQQQSKPNGTMNTSFASTIKSKGNSDVLRDVSFIPNQQQAPKTFQEIAMRNQARSIIQSVKNTVKKNFARDQLLKKSNSQIFKLPFMNTLDKKNRNQKQNLDFRSIIKHKREMPIYNENRPQIMAPSFLKSTRSFIQNMSQNMYQENSFCQKASRLYDAQDCNSINLSDRQSIEDFQGYSINNSMRDLSDRMSNQGNSVQLTKELNDINSKIKGILNSSLNFGKRASQEQSKASLTQRDELESYKMSQSNNMLSHPKMVRMSIDSEAQKSLMQTRTLSSINFSKKFSHYKKQLSESIVEKKTELSDFQLVAELGSGKYGKVYMAKHKHTGFICALKCVSKTMIKQQSIQIPFIREIKIQMYLNHPNIVKLYGFFNDEQNVYLIMEYCSDGHLLKLMKEKTAFEQSQILDILSNVFEAVSYMHCHGIIHRDLKPQNIVIQNGVFKLCDFGWAAYARGDARTTFCGTPLYVSPEILKGEQYDAKTDVWGLGIITYELAFGRVPFPIWSQADMRKIVSDPVYFPAWANVSQKMISLIKAMLFKNPEDRCSLNEILSNGIIKQYLGDQRGIKSEIDSLF